jgi:phosphopantetheinyl transferase
MPIFSDAYGSLPALAEVRLWFAALDQVQVAELTRFKSWFTAAENQQFSRFLSERRRQEFIIGRGLTRTALGALFNIEPHRIEFEADSRGKLTTRMPPEARGAHFSISHTHDIVVCAVCPQYPVGIDIERVVERLEPAALAERFFSESEYEVLIKLEGPSQQDRFFTMWTLKEALGKAHGLGVLTGTDTTHFDIIEPSILVALCWEPQFREAWLGTAKPGREHRLALSVLCEDSVSVNIHVERNQTALQGLSEPTWVQGRLRNRPIKT